MTGLLIVFRSITFAQRFKKIIERKGITATITRPDIETTGLSCSYAVKISETYLPVAIEELDRYGLYPAKLFIVKNGGYRELMI